ncbi:FCD domain-containing protein [Arthrobacter sp. M2012083]|uniref:FCD domain-containing protein n=1 Tax=Arthrobacter sp. M2012083 TaxID=1197706 RepID=UPI00030B4FE5|nr:FCD domain-containing protein [Arthrobacter sp. M2012083]
MHLATGAANLEAANDLDVEFHELIIRSSKSRHALQLWNNVQPRIRMQIYRLSERHSDMRAIPQEHQVLIDAFRLGSEEEIRRKVHDHIVGSAERLLAAGEKAAAGGLAL